MNIIPSVMEYVLYSLPVVITLKTLQIAARNFLVLSGGCFVVPNSNSESDRKRFVLRLQNLESVPFEHRAVLSISAILKNPMSPEEIASAVKVFAGAKSIDSSVEVVGRNFSWVCIFDNLPAFDTWTFECDLDAHSLDYRILAEGQNASPWIPTSFGKEVWPTFLRVNSADEQMRVVGPPSVPVWEVPVLASFLAVFVHVAVMAWSLGTIEEIPSEFSSLDWMILLVEISLIWLAFISIRRPVQPVVPGYSIETPCRPRVKIWAH